MEQKKIEEYPDYLIDTNGNVWSSKSNRFLSQRFNEFGYKVVQIKGNLKNNNIKIHRLVAKAFIPNPENKCDVNHINGIKADNRLENLEWNTRSENILHAHKLGLSKISESNRKIHSERCKLRIGENNALSRKVINTVSGKIYDSARIAAKENDINFNTLYKYLLGLRKNKTKLIYLDDLSNTINITAETVTETKTITVDEEYF